MLVIKELYGADADGNRGIYINEAELEEDDNERVCEAILAQFDEDVTDYDISLTDDEGREFQFRVNIYDWMTCSDIERAKAVVDR